MLAPSFRGGLRVATPADAAEVARLLHDFNSEFGEPSPGLEVLTGRLGALLAGDMTLAVLAGDPPVGLALVTLRSNVWYDGPVALFDEMYVVPSWRDRGVGSALLELCCELVGRRGVELVEIDVDGEDIDARRFYERHGFSCVSGSHGEPELRYSCELPAPGGPGGRGSLGSGER
ncbi:MAG TPA: GNAT family N-acetyltransferase [Acidimicrobiales bacterium]|nr:GNAT family N-acetyltransferase [Acidimicrobiales bacterium]